MSDAPISIPLAFEHLHADEQARRAREFRARMASRRSVRDFATTPVDAAIIRDCLMAAAGAPSGANRQPWHFVAIADPAVKRQIRLAAEAEERAFYGGRAGKDWLDALAPLGTDCQKPFLEHAPWLIAVFAERHGEDGEGRHVKNYYVPESVGIAIGFLVAALHHAGLATLTHTPAPMAFLGRICARPAREKPMVLLVCGHPAPEARVPDVARKPEVEVVTWLDPDRDG